MPESRVLRQGDQAFRDGSTVVALHEGTGCDTGDLLYVRNGSIDSDLEILVELASGGGDPFWIDYRRVGPTIPKLEPAPDLTDTDALRAWLE